MSPTKAPVVFIHGLWLHSTSWTKWAEMFAAAGHETHTPEWPGVADTIEETRANPDRQAGKGLAEIIRSHADFVWCAAHNQVLHMSRFMWSST